MEEQAGPRENKIQWVHLSPIMLVISLVEKNRKFSNERQSKTEPK